MFNNYKIIKKTISIIGAESLFFSQLTFSLVILPTQDYEEPIPVSNPTQPPQFLSLTAEEQLLENDFETFISESKIYDILSGFQGVSELGFIPAVNFEDFNVNDPNIMQSLGGLQILSSLYYAYFSEAKIERFGYLPKVALGASSVENNYSQYARAEDVRDSNIEGLLTEYLQGQHAPIIHKQAIYMLGPDNEGNFFPWKQDKYIAKLSDDEYVMIDLYPVDERFYNQELSQTQNVKIYLVNHIKKKTDTDYEIETRLIYIDDQIIKDYAFIRDYNEQPRRQPTTNEVNLYPGYWLTVKDNMKDQVLGKMRVSKVEDGGYKITTVNMEDVRHIEKILDIKTDIYGRALEYKRARWDSSGKMESANYFKSLLPTLDDPYGSKVVVEFKPSRAKIQGIKKISYAFTVNEWNFLFDFTPKLPENFSPQVLSDLLEAISNANDKEELSNLLLQILEGNFSGFLPSDEFELTMINQRTGEQFDLILNPAEEEEQGLVIHIEDIYSEATGRKIRETKSIYKASAGSILNRISGIIAGTITLYEQAIPLGLDETQQITTRYEYDEKGRVIKDTTTAEDFEQDKTVITATEYTYVARTESPRGGRFIEGRKPRAKRISKTTIVAGEIKRIEEYNAEGNKQGHIIKYGTITNNDNEETLELYRQEFLRGLTNYQGEVSKLGKYFFYRVDQNQDPSEYERYGLGMVDMNLGVFKPIFEIKEIEGEENTYGLYNVMYSEIAAQRPFLWKLLKVTGKAQEFIEKIANNETVEIPNPMFWLEEAAQEVGLERLSSRRGSMYEQIKESWNNYRKLLENDIRMLGLEVEGLGEGEDVGQETITIRPPEGENPFVGNKTVLKKKIKVEVVAEKVRSQRLGLGERILKLTEFSPTGQRLNTIILDVEDISDLKWIIMKYYAGETIFHQYPEIQKTDTVIDALKYELVYDSLGRLRKFTNYNLETFMINKTIFPVYDSVINEFKGEKENQMLYLDYLENDILNKGDVTEIYNALEQFSEQLPNITDPRNQDFNTFTLKRAQAFPIPIPTEDTKTGPAWEVTAPRDFNIERKRGEALADLAPGNPVGPINYLKYSLERLFDYFGFDRNIAWEEFGNKLLKFKKAGKIHFMPEDPQIKEIKIVPEDTDSSTNWHVTLAYKAPFADFIADIIYKNGEGLEFELQDKKYSDGSRVLTLTLTKKDNGWLVDFENDGKYILKILTTQISQAFLNSGEGILAQLENILGKVKFGERGDLIAFLPYDYSENKKGIISGVSGDEAKETMQSSAQNFWEQVNTFMNLIGAVKLYNELEEIKSTQNIVINSTGVDPLFKRVGVDQDFWFSEELDRLDKVLKPDIMDWILDRFFDVNNFIMSLVNQVTGVTLYEGQDRFVKMIDSNLFYDTQGRGFLSFADKRKESFYTPANIQAESFTEQSQFQNWFEHIFKNIANERPDVQLALLNTLWEIYQVTQPWEFYEFMRGEIFSPDVPKRLGEKPEIRNRARATFAADLFKISHMEGKTWNLIPDEVSYNASLLHISAEKNGQILELNLTDEGVGFLANVMGEIPSPVGRITDILVDKSARKIIFNYNGNGHELSFDEIGNKLSEFIRRYTNTALAGVQMQKPQDQDYLQLTTSLYGSPGDLDRNFGEVTLKVPTRDYFKYLSYPEIGDDWSALEAQLTPEYRKMVINLGHILGAIGLLTVLAVDLGILTPALPDLSVPIIANTNLMRVYLAIRAHQRAMAAIRALRIASSLGNKLIQGLIGASRGALSFIPFSMIMMRNQAGSLDFYDIFNNAGIQFMNGFFYSILFGLAFNPAILGVPGESILSSVVSAPFRWMGRAINRFAPKMGGGSWFLKVGDGISNIAGYGNLLAKAIIGLKGAKIQNLRYYGYFALTETAMEELNLPSAMAYIYREQARLTGTDPWPTDEMYRLKSFARARLRNTETFGSLAELLDPLEDPFGLLVLPGLIPVLREHNWGLDSILLIGPHEEEYN